jgi:hypothetical protein
MKKFAFMLFFLSTLNFVLGQDQLFKKDNSKQEVKILEVTPTEVKYKLFSNQEGPTYVINKKDVALIIYKNGDHEAFKDSEAQVQNPGIIQNTVPIFYTDSFLIKNQKEKKKRNDELCKAKNFLYYNAIEMFYSSLGFDYMHEFLDNRLELHVPMSFSIDKGSVNYNSVLGIDYPENTSNYRIQQKAFEIGLGLYLNTSGKKAVSHYIGPLFRFGQYNGVYDVNTKQYVNTGNYYNYVYSADRYGFVMNQTYLMINNGLVIRAAPDFSIMMNVALGFVTSRHYVANDPIIFKTSPNALTSTSTLAAQFGFCFGYRF